MAENTKFRKAALKQFTSPEQLDQLIQVVTPQSWIIAGTLYAILLLLLIWSIIGNVPTRAGGPGILLAGGGDIYNAVAPDGPSRIAAIKVKPGDQVSKGQVIVILARPDLLEQIKVTQNYLTDLEGKLANLTTLSKQEIATHHQQLEQERQSLKQALADSNEKFKHLGEFLALRQAALQKGIETRQNVEQTLQEYYNVKGEIDAYADKLVQLDINETNFLDQWHERLRELDLKITDEKVKLANLQTRLKLSVDVTSPVSGTATAIQAALGSIVNTGAPIVSIASAGVGLDALVYLPPQVGKRIKPGMQALISPTTVEKAEFGSIEGQVMSVSNFPVTTEAMQATLQNTELVKEFVHEEAPIEVRIQLLKDPNTFSQLKWSSSSGPKHPITPGTLVTGMITIREQAPITLLIPAFKKLTGIE